MNPNDISWIGAFLAGVLSFLSPCVLPLVPAYLSFLAGTSLDQLKASSGESSRRHLLLSAVAFVLGFSLLFILLGASATWIGRWLLQHSALFGRLAGVLLIVLGLHVSGLVPIRFLMMEKRLNFSSKPLGKFGAFLIGMAFAFGWTPCVGPLLAGILALAGTQQTVTRGILLLAAYSAGLGIPFLLAAWGTEWFLGWMRRWQRLFRWVEIAAGVLLLLIGLLMVTGSLGRISSWFSGLGFLSL
jgi:cytochrome c-type biogenesis protein